MDVFCRRCQHWEPSVRSTHRGEACPVCGAVLSQRRRPSPSPATHLRALLDALRTTPGVLFLVLYALTLGVSSAAGRPYLAALLLYAGAVRLAWRAMNMRGHTIEFPQLGADDLFDSDVLMGVGLFSLSFVVLPAVLIQLALDGRLLSLPAAIAIGGALFLYAPMALLLYLRSNTALGMFALPAAVGLVAADPRGYAFLSALVLAALGLRLALSAATNALGIGGALALGFVLAPVEAALVLVAFGLCGLFVRSKARQLRVACDDDDWEPGSSVEDHASPTPAPRPAPPEQPVALPPVQGADGQILLADELPAVTGQLVAGLAPAPAPVVAPQPGPTARSQGGPAAGPAIPLAWDWDAPPPVVVGSPADPAGLAASAAVRGTSLQPAAPPGPARAAATQIMGSVQVPAPSVGRPAIPAPVSGLQAVAPVRPVRPVDRIPPPGPGAPRLQWPDALVDAGTAGTAGDAGDPAVPSPPRRR